MHEVVLDDQRVRLIVGPDATTVVASQDETRKAVSYPSDTGQLAGPTKEARKVRTMTAGVGTMEVRTG